MPLLTPRFVVLDSASLGKASRDYRSSDRLLRSKARRFLAQTLEHGIYVTFTLTHVLELLRHNDADIVWDRLAFFRALPLIAWVRPHNRTWFPGGIHDLLRRELHAIVHADKRDWPAVVEHVRTDLWETGCGSEMFVDDDALWLTVRKEAQRQHCNELYLASVLRTDPGQIYDLTVGEIDRLPRRSKEERAAFVSRFAAIMNRQLECHGDLRFESSQQAAISYSKAIARDVESFAGQGGDPIHRMLEFYGVPKDLVKPDMTVSQVGQLAVYIKQLKLLSTATQPPVRVTVRDVPPASLPSYVLQQKLATIQNKATRVSGSNVGDAHIAPLTLYADGVEVDKRTHEFLTQIQRSDRSLEALMQPFFRSRDYEAIPDRFALAP